MLVKCTGNPRVFPRVPVPVPEKTRTCHRGYGFWTGQHFVTLGSTHTRTRRYGYGFYPQLTTNDRPRSLRHTSMDVAIRCARWEIGGRYAHDGRGADETRGDEMRGNEGTRRERDEGPGRERTGRRQTDETRRAEPERERTRGVGMSENEWERNTSSVSRSGH